MLRVKNLGSIFRNFRCPRSYNYQVSKYNYQVSKYCSWTQKIDDIKNSNSSNDKNNLNNPNNPNNPNTPPKKVTIELKLNLPSFKNIINNNVSRISDIFKEVNEQKFTTCTRKFLFDMNDDKQILYRICAGFIIFTIGSGIYIIREDRHNGFSVVESYTSGLIGGSLGGLIGGGYCFLLPFTLPVTILIGVVSVPLLLCSYTTNTNKNKNRKYNSALY